MALSCEAPISAQLSESRSSQFDGQTESRSSQFDGQTESPLKTQSEPQVWIKETLKVVYPVLDRWSDRLVTNGDLLSEEGHSLYSLLVVGGMAVNAQLPRDKVVKTRDLDLKLVYHYSIDPDQFWKSFVDFFNPLRTRIMLEIKNAVNKYAMSNKEKFSNLCTFVPDEYFAVGIAYKCPYLINSLRDSYRCVTRYPNMVHMVFSLLYHVEGEDTPTSLVDLSMFVNLNNPDYLYGRTPQNFLYEEYASLFEEEDGASKGKDFLPTVRLSVKNPLTTGPQLRRVLYPRVRVVAIGFVLSDLYWMSFLHHRDVKKDAAKEKLKLLLDQLACAASERIRSLVKEISCLIEVDPSNEENSEVRAKLLAYFHELSQLQINKKIPIYNHF